MITSASWRSVLNRSVFCIQEVEFSRILSLLLRVSAKHEAMD